MCEVQCTCILLILAAYILPAFFFPQVAERNQFNLVVPNHCGLLESPGEHFKIYRFHDFDLFDLG